MSKISVNFRVYRGDQDYDFVIDVSLCPAEPDVGIERPYMDEYEIKKGDLSIQFTPDEENQLYICASELAADGCFDEGDDDE